MREARRLGLPVIALVDTNCDPDEAEYVIPGNDDAIRSCSLIVKAIAAGIEAGKQRVTPAELAAPPQRRRGHAGGSRCSRRARVRHSRCRDAGCTGRGRRGSCRAGPRCSRPSRFRPSPRPQLPRRPSPAAHGGRGGACSDGRGRRRSRQPRSSRAGARRARGGGGVMTDISAAMVKQLRDATSAGMMDCKRALVGDRRRLRRRRQAPAREGHGVGRQARRPRDHRGRRPRTAATTRHGDDRRRRLRDRAGLEERRLPRLRAGRAHARCTRAARTPSPGSRSGASTSPRKLGENIQVVGARRHHGGRRRVVRRLRPPAREQGRRARRDEGRLARARRASSRCTSRSRGRRTARATRCRPSSSTPSARSSRSCPRSSRSPSRRPREDRRRDAEQALLRRVRARGADVDPRHGPDRDEGAASRADWSWSSTPGSRSADGGRRRAREAPSGSPAVPPDPAEALGRGADGPGRVRPRRGDRSTRSRASSSRCTRPGSSSRS